MTHGKFGEGKHRAALFAALRGKKASGVSFNAAAGAVKEAEEEEEAGGDAAGDAAGVGAEGGGTAAAAALPGDTLLPAGIPVIAERESERDSEADAALGEAVSAVRTRGEERSGTLTAGDLLRADIEQLVSAASSSGGPMHAPTMS